MNSKPDAIIKTISINQILEYPGGIKGILNEFTSLNDQEDGIWCLRIAQKPKYEVLYCYVLFNKKIQLRCNIAQVFESPTGKMSFTSEDGESERVIKGKYWLILTAPVIFPDHTIPMKGFRGFRYSELIF